MGVVMGFAAALFPELVNVGQHGRGEDFLTFCGPHWQRSVLSHP